MTDLNSNGRRVVDPADYDMPADYRCWPGDPAEDHIGPFFYRSMAPKSETAIRLARHHCNMMGIAHGGVLMMFADYTLCMSALDNDQQLCVTVNCDNQFVASAKEGDLLVGRGELIRKTRSLAFVRCTLSVDEQVVLTASATLKMLSPR